MQWMMLQQDHAKDYVIATGVQYSVRDFVRKTAAELGITLDFVGSGVDEKAVVRSVEGDSAPGVKPGDVVVSVDPRYFRPAEVETLLGDPSLAKKDLGWIPEITLDEMISEMVANDLEASRQHSLLKTHGYRVAVSKED
jgi:GDPmannose 4,6-dehydratase